MDTDSEYNFQINSKFHGLLVLAKKLFVGGLSWGTTDAGLRAAFERFGEVADAKVIVDRDTGRSRGFGFVSYNAVLSGSPVPRAQIPFNRLGGVEVTRLVGRSVLKLQPRIGGEGRKSAESPAKTGGPQPALAVG